MEGNILFRMTQLIYDEMKSYDSDLKIFTEDHDQHSEVWMRFGIKNGGSYRIRYINGDDDNDTAVRVFGIVTLEQDQISKILPLINQLNNEYRYVKFICDNDGDINLEYDFPLNSVNTEKSAVEMMIRIVNIVDTVYPKIMQAIWC